jgi:hypothetical protein
MKSLLTVLFILTTFLVNAQSSVILNLKLTGDLYFSRTPGSNSSIRMTLQDKLPSLQVIATDNTISGRLQKEEPFLNGRGKRAFLVAFPELYRFSAQNDQLTFYFGEKGAENNLDQAVVRISYQGAKPSRTKSMNRQSLIFPVSSSELFTVPLSGSPAEEINGKRFLLVEASGEKPVNVEIDREEQRGRVLVGIFSQKTGNLLASLNPKDTENTASVVSFTADETVLIIPVVRPSEASSENQGRVVFEVGDPREVATVTVSEE